MINFAHSFHSEWLKKKRSAASWLTLAGGFFIPVIMLIARFTEFDKLPDANRDPHLWETLLNNCWQFMAFFLLPMGVILATSLITQLEFRNNTWKQLHTTPQSFTVVFFAKLAVIGTMLLQYFILFNIGIYLAGVTPALFSGVPYPPEPFPFQLFLETSARFFLGCLPIVALQYFLSLQFRNFMLPLGAGIGLFVASMIALRWKYGYTVPYAYCALTFVKNLEGQHADDKIEAWAAGYFILFLLLGYLCYIFKKEKG